MTANKEDYLKILYDEGGQGALVPNKVIAEQLGISPASVTEMLAKLQKQNLIEYEPYKGSRLTDQGMAACVGLVRSHRLWEVFLMEHLGYTWREAHEDAHLLEHATTERMVERLDDFLGHPQYCPHGSRIPQSNELPQKQISLGGEKLSDLSTGDSARIIKIHEDSDLLDYLQKSGLKIGSRIKVLSVDDYEGPITFAQNGMNIVLSYKAAQQIFIERL